MQNRFKAFEKKLLYIIILRNPSDLFMLSSMARWAELFKGLIAEMEELIITQKNIKLICLMK